ncbi:hypothetical protein ACFST9_03235 [Hymenobacter monticola]|uniref:Gliding motility-associated protein GldM first immunoglobulin-like domain-containing protein n=1 Tax=Hymenobacter monticola TaxID=1705399 RepID=A0ABY4B5I5_9BACT|nr:hypothetical protein [Hymenobacter monticola]UOE33028.1 hypothetical protein MTP16_18090 [Hymenobacter monticola]
MKRPAFYLVMVLVLGAAIGAVFYRQYRAQRQLNAQLQEMSDLLMSDNAAADKAAEGTVKGINAAVQKNQNQPRERAVLAAAESLDRRADSLVHTLWAHAEKLLLATQNVNGLPTLRHPNETRAVTEQLGNASPAHQHLRQQLQAFDDTLRALHPSAAAHLTTPAFEGQTVALALATCAELESAVRAAEADVLRHLATQVGPTQLRRHPMALAEAESKVVAPGELYRARMLWLEALGPSPARLQMRCNGQPVPVGADLVGQVRFVAPQRPGPAVWTASIRFQTMGRDTTFQVRVPYRVARR